MRRLILLLSIFCLLPIAPAWAGIFGRVHGIVHDPQHRPIAGAHVILKAAHSSFTAITLTVTEANYQAVKLYQDSGFVTRHRFDAMVCNKAEDNPTHPTA